MLLLGLLLSAHALVHPNGLIEVRIDRGSLLSGLPGLERGLRVAQAEPATGLPTATGLLLILQDASERTESDRAVLATREGSTRLDLLRREYAALEAIRTLSRTMPVIAASTGELSDATLPHPTPPYPTLPHPTPPCPTLPHPAPPYPT